MKFGLIDAPMAKMTRIQALAMKMGRCCLGENSPHKKTSIWFLFRRTRNPPRQTAPSKMAP